MYLTGCPAGAAALPAGRVPGLRDLVGITVSTGWMARIRGKAAALIADGGFIEGMDRSATVSDADGVLPGYAGVIVRDSYHAG